TTRQTRERPVTASQKTANPSRKAPATEAVLGPRPLRGAGPSAVLLRPLAGAPGAALVSALLFFLIRAKLPPSAFWSTHNPTAVRLTRKESSHATRYEQPPLQCPAYRPRALRGWADPRCL